MTKTKKLGRGLEDFSHLFLTAPSERIEKDKDGEVPEAGTGERALKSARTICVIAEVSVPERYFIAKYLALEFVRNKMNTVVIDADFSFPRLSMLMDGIPHLSLLSLITSNDGVEDCFRKPVELLVLTLDADISTAHLLGPRERSSLYGCLSSIEESADLVLVLASPGSGRQMEVLMELANEVIVVVPQPLGEMINAYGIIKAISGKKGSARLGIIATRIKSPGQADTTFRKMQQVVQKFLHIPIYDCGFIGDSGDILQSAAVDISLSPTDASKESMRSIADIASRLLKTGGESPQSDGRWAGLAEILVNNKSSRNRS